jgi:DNA-binding MarR family transcriptional regulator
MEHLYQHIYVNILFYVCQHIDIQFETAQIFRKNQSFVSLLNPAISVNSFPNYQKIVNLNRAYSAVEAAFEAALSPLGLSPEQWDVLRHLREHSGASGADIARCAKVTPQAVATMLQRLEKSRLITRRSSERGRVVEAYLTAQGEALLQKGDEIAEKIEVQVFSTFSQDEQEQFNRLLLRCIENLEGADLPISSQKLESDT